MDWITSALVNLAASIISIFPESPFAHIDGDFVSWLSTILPYVNWFIPFDKIVATLGLWLAAIAIYYVYQIVLRWIKVVE